MVLLQSHQNAGFYWICRSQKNRQSEDCLKYLKSEIYASQTYGLPPASAELLERRKKQPRKAVGKLGTRQESDIL